MANEMNKEKLKKTVETVEDKYYYEPWHPSMDKPRSAEAEKYTQEMFSNIDKLIKAKSQKKA